MRKIKIIILVCLAVLIVSSGAAVFAGMMTGSASESGAQFSSKNGGYTAHDPIYINGNSNFTVTNGVSNPSAAGTASDPYIIENWVINASTGTNAGIDIKNTGKYFVIRNCSVYDGKITNKQGIVFYNVKNGTIGNVTLENNYYGVYFGTSSYNNISANTKIFNSAADGIYISTSNNNTLFGVNASSNTGYGITLYRSENNAIKNSFFGWNTGHGIYLKESKNNNLENTNISYTTGKGVTLYTYCNGTYMKNITVYKNSDIGIDLGNSSYCNISDSFILTNTGTGIDYGGATIENDIYNTAVKGNNGTGIDLQGSSYVDIVSCNISQNKGSGGLYSGSAVTNINITNTDVWNNLAGNGIDFYGATWVNITGSKFIANAGNGIGFGGDTKQECNTIKNCVIGENTQNGIYFYAYYSDGNSYIQNNNIYSNTIYSNTQNGIYFYAYHSPYIQNNNIYSNTIYSNNQNGIYFYADPSQSTAGYIQNNNIYSNIIYSNNQNGIHFCAYSYYSAYYYYIQNNNIYSNTIYSNNQNGIYFYASPSYPSPYTPYIQNNNIYSNTIYSNGQNGIYFYAWAYASYIQNNNIYSNTIYSNDQNGIYFYAASYIQNNNIYSNTIYSNDQNGIYFYAYSVSSSYSYIQNNNICSNTIYQHSNGSGNHFIADNPAETWQESNLYNNTITSNLIGIKFLRINSHVVYTNNISNSKNDGILLDSSTSNTLRYNTLSNNNWTGINLTSSSNDNIIENNNITNSSTGIWISGSSNGNTIRRNDLFSCSGIGVKITGSTGNKIHHTNFKWNTQNAYDNTNALNQWDDGSKGNWWSDYAGMDLDGNGIGDTPYSIPSGGSKDYYPFMMVLNFTPPTSYVNPISPYWQTSTPFTITATASESSSGVANVALYYRHSNNNSTWGSWTLFGIDSSAPWEWSFNFTDGNGHYEFYTIATDSEGNYESAPISADAMCGINVLITSHAPIYIISNSDFASQAENESWAGDGTEGNPYVIENYDINAGSADGIYIWNTNVYFIIRNCMVQYGGISYCGIYFLDVINGKIDNVTLYNNICGIFLDSSSNNQITNCDVYNNSYGIYLSSSSNNTISTCNIYNNYEPGGYSICLDGSSNNLIYNNYFNNTNNAYSSGGTGNCWNINKTAGTNIINGSYLGGNFWSDYTGTDSNGDGIGDTPYTIPGGSGEQDHLPLWEGAVTYGVDYIQIRTAAGGTGSVVTSFNLAPGGARILYAARYNNSAGFIEDSPASTTWVSSAPSVATVTSPGSSTTVTSVNPGSALITVNDAGVTNTTTVIVSSWTVDYILIMDAAGGVGSEIGTLTYAMGNTDTFYACGFNYTGPTYVAGVSVTWTSSVPGVGTVVTGPATSTLFTAVSAGTCIVSEDDGDPGTTDDSTGTITVAAAGIDFVQIHNNTWDGPVVGAVSMTTDDTLTLWCAGYNYTSGFVTNVSATWGKTGTLDAPPGGPATNILFNPSIAGTSGTITVTTAYGNNATGTITVSAVVTTGTISGTVKDSVTEEGIPGATVTAYNTGTTTVANTTTTGSDGTYSMELEAGTYDVEASADGYETSDKRTETVTAGADTPNVNFALTAETVDTTGPTITNLLPVDDSTVSTGTPTISASYADPSGINIGSVVLKVDTVDVTSNATRTVTGVSYTPAAALSDGVHTVYLEVKDASNNSNAANTTWSFTVDTELPVITHTPVTSGTEGEKITITATITDINLTAAVFYRVTGTGGYTGKSMTYVSGNTYSADIPASAVTTAGVEYYIWASDGVNNATHPATNPETSPHSITVSAAVTTGTISGTVVNPVTEEGIPDATVTAYDGTTTVVTITASDGRYSMGLEAGTYDVTASKTGYESDTVTNVSVIAGQTTSNVNFALTPEAVGELSVVLNSPTGGEVWAGGQEHTIRYTITDGSPSYNVVISYSTAGGAEGTFTTIDEIAHTEEGMYAYCWLVPEIDANMVVVRINVTDYTFSTDSKTSSTFTIDSTPPKIEILNTSAGGSVSISKPITIVFSEKMNQTAAQAAFSISPNPLGWSWSWNLAGDTMTGTHNDFVFGTTYTATITTAAKDLAGNYLANDYSWNFTAGMSVYINSPILGDVWTGNTIHNIEYEITGGVAPYTVTIEYTTDDANYNIIGNTTKDAEGIYSCSWVSPMMDSNTVTVKIIVVDTDGTESSDTSGNFEIDSTAPTILEYTGNDTHVLPTENIMVVFSEEMNYVSVESAFILEDSDGNPVNGTFSWDENVMMFTPDAELASGADYTVTINTTAKDKSEPGNCMSSAYQWSFTIVVTQLVTETFEDPDTGATATVQYTGTGTVTITSASSPGSSPSGVHGINIFVEVTVPETMTVEWVRIIVPYNESDLPAGVDESKLRLFYWTGSGWEKCEETNVDTTYNFVYANVTHLTIFAPMAEKTVPSEGVISSSFIIVLVCIIILVCVMGVGYVKRKKKGVGVGRAVSAKPPVAAVPKPVKPSRAEVVAKETAAELENRLNVLRGEIRRLLGYSVGDLKEEAGKISDMIKGGYWVQAQNALTNLEGKVMSRKVEKDRYDQFMVRVNELTKERSDFFVDDIKAQLSKGDFDKAEQLLVERRRDYERYLELVGNVKDVEEEVTMLSRRLAKGELTSDAYERARDDLDRRKYDIDEKLWKIQRKIFREKYEKPF